MRGATRIQQGSVVFNKRFGTWNFLWARMTAGVLESSALHGSFQSREQQGVFNRVLEQVVRQLLQIIPG